jgi:hypothetical protein
MTSGANLGLPREALGGVVPVETLVESASSQRLKPKHDKLHLDVAVNFILFPCNTAVLDTTIRCPAFKFAVQSQRAPLQPGFVGEVRTAKGGRLGGGKDEVGRCRLTLSNPCCKRLELSA